MKTARDQAVMFFHFGLSGFFHVFLKNGHNIGVRAKNLPKEAMSIACSIPVIPFPLHKADRIIRPAYFHALQ